MSFEIPWDTAHNPIKAIQRMRRRKRKRDALEAAVNSPNNPQNPSNAPSTEPPGQSNQSTLWTPDQRSEGVFQNKAHESRNVLSAKAQQESFNRTHPWHEFVDLDDW